MLLLHELLPQVATTAFFIPADEEAQPSWKLQSPHLPQAEQASTCLRFALLMQEVFAHTATFGLFIDMASCSVTLVCPCVNGLATARYDGLIVERMTSLPR